MTRAYLASCLEINILFEKCKMVNNYELIRFINKLLFKLMCSNLRLLTSLIPSTSLTEQMRLEDFLAFEIKDGPKIKVSKPSQFRIPRCCWTRVPTIPASMGNGQGLCKCPSTFGTFSWERLVWRKQSMIVILNLNMASSILR